MNLCYFNDDSLDNEIPVERITKLEIKNESLAISVEMTDSEVKETIAKLLANFSKDDIIDILVELIHGKNN